jgi:NaMN:DMB phosphoribosyltransferase
MPQFRPRSAAEMFVVIGESMLSQTRTPLAIGPGVCDVAGTETSGEMTGVPADFVSAAKSPVTAKTTPAKCKRKAG